ncbi:MAG: gliding motility lipoprotein GldH [Chitinophagales bacterium]|nr:gliding motility lipoprotein GldH [Chitinophagales bacterium]
MTKSLQRVCVLIIGTCLFFLTSCDSKRVYEENIDIPSYIWNLDFKPTFNVTIEDTAQLYNIYVNVRHTTYYPNSNLWVLITTQFPDGNKIEKRVNLPLADKTGKWDGECLGDICDAQIQIQENAFFNQPGNYSFQLAQIMRTNNLPLVMSVGLRVEKVGEKKE